MTILFDTTLEKGITVNVCTPGLVRGTGHLANSPLMGALCAKVITYPWMWLFMKSADKGAQVSFSVKQTQENE